jgi:hypothetical protein
MPVFRTYKTFNMLNDLRSNTKMELVTKRYVILVNGMGTFRQLFINPI